MTYNAFDDFIIFAQTTKVEASFFFAMRRGKFSRWIFIISHVFKSLFEVELRSSSVVNATSYTTPTMSSSNRFFVSGESQDAYSCLPMCCLSDSGSRSLRGIRRTYTKKSIPVIFHDVFIASCVFLHCRKFILKSHYLEESDSN